MHLQSHSKLTFHELNYTSEHIIGRRETGNYIQTNETGVKVYLAANKGKTVDQIQKLYPDTDTTRFLYELMHEGFVDTVDSKKLPNRKQEKYLKLLNNIKPTQISWLFSNAMIAIYLIIIFIGITIFALNTKYLPVAEDYFFTTNLSLLLFTSVIVSWILILFHELGHYIAARSYNLLTRFGISNRYYYIVAITDVTNVYSIKRKDRFRVFFGGMIVDAIIMAICAMILLLADKSIISMNVIAYLFVKFMILSQFLGLAWQFLFFLKTDLYYIFENIFDIYNVQEKVYGMLKSTITKTKYLYNSSREKVIMWIYTPILVFGIFALGLLFVFYSLPMLIGIIKRLFTNIFLFNEPRKFYDAVAFLLVTMLEYILLATIIIKKNIHKPVIKLVAMTLLLLGEFFLTFIVIVSTTVANSKFTLYAAAICGILFIIPLHHIWKELKPTGEIRTELIAILLIISAVYLTILSQILLKFYEITKTNITAENTIIYFMSTTSIRLSDSENAFLEECAGQEKITKSDLIKKAIREYRKIRIMRDSIHEALNDTEGKDLAELGIDDYLKIIKSNE